MDMGSGVSCADARGVEREEVKMMMMVACAGERVDDRIESNAGVCMYDLQVCFGIIVWSKSVCDSWCHRIA